jgi:DNA-binding transcriptional LysR family regulator
MDIHQLKTFVTVAREGSITRASALLHLSQPAVSAHIKALEDALGLTLFERTARGMSVTPEGRRLLAKAEQTIAAHQELMAEANRSKGRLTGTLRVGAGSNSSNEAVGRLLTRLAERHPDVEVVLRHRSSREVLAGIRNGTLDAGFYNEPGEPEGDLATVEVAQFTTFLMAAPGVVTATRPLDWSALANLPWVYPTDSACCTRTAEELFSSHGFKPRRIISADRQDLTRTLVASGVGVGLLHADAAREAERRGEIELLLEADTRVRVLFACLASRARDPLLIAASSITRAKSED